MQVAGKQKEVTGKYLHSQAHQQERPGIKVPKEEKDCYTDGDSTAARKER